MDSITQIGTKMREVLQDAAEKAAQKVQLIQRRGKVTGANLCQTLVFGWWENPEATLEELTQVGRSVGLEITPQGLDQRWTEKTAAYLKQVLEDVVATKIRGHEGELPGMSAFSHVYVEDSSVVTLPKAMAEVWQGLGGKGTGSAVKLQTRLDLKQGELDGPHLADGKTHDRAVAHLSHPKVEQGSLHLRDVGYWKLSDWQEAAEQEYSLILRMKASTHFWFEGKAWTAAQWCGACKATPFDCSILLGSNDKIPVRFIGVRASDKVAQERRRKLKRSCQERGQVASLESLALCDWTLIVTNLPVERLSIRDALIWLGVRWQIELLFKLWKSVGKINQSRSKKPWRILCELYAKLIALTLMQWLFLPTFWSFPDRSWTKAARTIQIHVIRIAIALPHPEKLHEVITDICRILAAGCRINPSQKHKRTYQKLASLGGSLA